MITRVYKERYLNNTALKIIMASSTISSIANHNQCTHFPLLNLSEIAQTMIYSDHEMFFAKFLLPTLLVIGVIGNATFIYAVARIKRLHSITNLYLVNLAVADILFLLMAIPIYIASIISSPIRDTIPWESRFGCISVKAVAGSFYFTSLGLVSLVTLERYLAICHPFHHRGINTIKRTVKLVVVTWLIGIMLGLCLGFGDGQLVRYCLEWPDTFITFPTEVSMCKTARSDLILLEELSKTIPFIIALTGNTYMYFRIMRALGGRNFHPEEKSEESTQSKFQSQANKVRNQVARLLIVNGLIFFMSQTLARVLSTNILLEQTLDVRFLNSEIYSRALIISRLMLFMNSVVNPIVYNLTSSIYRQAFREAFCRRNHRHIKEDGQSQNTYSMSVTRDN